MSVVSSAVGLLQQTTKTTRGLVSALVADHTAAIAIVPAILLTLGVIYNAVFFSVLDIPVLHLSSTIDFLIPGLRQIFTALLIVFGGLCLILALAALDK